MSMKHVPSAFLLAAILSGAILAWNAGLFDIVLEQPPVTKLLCAVIVAWAALCWGLSFMDHVWIVHGRTVATALGLFGAALGIAQALAVVGSDMSVMAPKIGLVMYSSITGIGCAILLYLQSIALSMEIRR